MPPLLGRMSITPSSREGHAGPYWPMSNPGTFQQCSRRPTLQQQECAQGSSLQSLAPVFLEDNNSSIQAKRGSLALFTLAEKMHHGRPGRLAMPSAVPHTGFQHFHGRPACHLCSDSSASRQAAERGMLLYTDQCPTQGHPSNAAAVQYQRSRSVHRLHLQSLAPVLLEGNNSSLAFMWLHPGLSQQPANSVLCNGGAAVTLQMCRQCHGRSNLVSASP